MTRPSFFKASLGLSLLALAIGCQPVVANLPSSSTQILSAVPVQVYAAASLTDAFKAIGKDFEAKNHNSLVAFKFAGSQDLVAEINKGSAADVFASADQAHMNMAVESRRAIESDVQTFVRNRLIIVQPLDAKKKLKSPTELAQPGLKLVAANSDVPVGRYTIEFLNKASQDPAYGASFKTKVVENIVSYETNVRLVLDKVAKGTADAGFVYVSDALVAQKDVTTVKIPNNLNPVATYPIVTLATADRKPAAKAFVDYVLADPAQQKLKEFGFIPAAGDD
jgi:molybdate transport system substrate-binding protein